VTHLRKMMLEELERFNHGVIATSPAAFPPRRRVRSSNAMSTRAARTRFRDQGGVRSTHQSFSPAHYVGNLAPTQSRCDRRKNCLEDMRVVYNA
jgi:hypothetical protein